MAQPVKSNALSATLQGAASRAAELAGAGACLLFTVDSEPSDADESPVLRLRSAAGFNSEDAARSAASAAVPTVRECLKGGASAEADCADAPRDMLPGLASGGLLLVPLT